jgi:DNA-binding GntR family transcriptional regulator
VREAFGRLEAEGLVVVRPNRGAFVAVLTAEELREAYELRALVEGDLLTRAVTGLTAAHLARAEALHAALAADDPGEQGDLNREFHRVLLPDPADRPRQRALVEQLRGGVERYERVQRALLGETAAFPEDHRRVLDACRRNDPDGALASLKGHLAALVTGGTRGIGRAIAVRLAEEGCRVGVCGWDRGALRETAEYLRERGADAVGVEADVSRAGEVERFVAGCADSFGS